MVNGATYTVTSNANGKMASIDGIQVLAQEIYTTPNGARKLVYVIDGLLSSEDFSNRITLASQAAENLSAMSRQELWQRFKAVKAEALMLENQINNMATDWQNEVYDPDVIPSPPDQVVRNYIADINRYLDDEVPASFLTVERVGRILHDFIKNQDVFDMDFQIVYNKGWRNHSLADSNPRSSIIDDIYEEWERQQNSL